MIFSLFKKKNKGGYYGHGAPAYGVAPAYGAYGISHGIAAAPVGMIPFSL